MVATQQVWENHDMGALGKERLTVVLTCRKRWLHPMPSSYDECQKLFSSRCDIEDTIEPTVVAQPKHKTYRLPTFQPYHPRVL
jgi:hypothetical protein